MSLKYQEIYTIIEEINKRLSKSFSYLYLRNEIHILVKNEDNVNLINKYYLAFYSTIKESLRVNSILEISKIFDKNSWIRFDKLINLLKQYNKSLTWESFKKINKDRIFVDELKDRYQKINNEDIEKYKKILHNHEWIINDIKSYRDEYIAHDDLNKKTYNFTTKELEDLLKWIEEITNKITRKIDFSSTNRDYFKNKPWSQLNDIFNILTKHEIKRLEKIKNKAN